MHVHGAASALERASDREREYVTEGAVVGRRERRMSAVRVVRVRAGLAVAWRGVALIATGASLESTHSDCVAQFSPRTTWIVRTRLFARAYLQSHQRRHHHTHHTTRRGTRHGATCMQDVSTQAQRQAGRQAGGQAGRRAGQPACRQQAGKRQGSLETTRRRTRSAPGSR